MRSPFRRRKFDAAYRVLAAGMAGLCGFAGYSRGLGALSPLGQAIAGAEGYGQPGAVPTVANNPGDLELGEISVAEWTPAANGNEISNFPTADAGAAALENQINLIATGQSTAGYTPSMSIAQVGQLYSGGSSNWANNVAKALGVSPSATFPAWQRVGGFGSWASRQWAGSEPRHFR